MLHTTVAACSCYRVMSETNLVSKGNTFYYKH